MPKYLVSTTLKDPEWNNTTVLDSGDATAAGDQAQGRVRRRDPGPRQSNRLVHELLDSDLVDQVNLMIFPTVLGVDGREDRLRPDFSDKLDLEARTEAKPVGPDGVARPRLSQKALAPEGVERRDHGAELVGDVAVQAQRRRRRRRASGPG